MKEEEFTTRKFNIESRTNSPHSLDETNRTVDITISTTTPVLEYDYRSDQMVPTVIIPEGIHAPDKGQIPLVDTHDMSTIENQLGSVSELRAEGDEYIGKARFAEDTKSEKAFELTRNKHLTDFSIRSATLEYTILEEGENAEIMGRNFTGPVKVITSSRLIEVSAVSVGADPKATSRSAHVELVEPNQTEVKETKRMSKEEEVIAPVETVVAPVVERAAPVDTEAIRMEVIETERARVSDINSVARELNLDSDFVGKVEHESISDFKQRAYAQVSENMKEVSVTSPTITAGADATDKQRAAFSDALLLRSGQLGDDVSAERREIAREAAGYSLVEMARESLRSEGKEYKGDRHEMVGRALASSDFPILCGNIAQKSVMAGFDSTDETYGSWVDTSGSVSDFKTQTKARAGEFSDLEEVKEGEEYKIGDRPEQSETFKIAKYGKLLPFTRESLINDDLGQLTDSAFSMGEAASRKLGDLAYAVLTLNANMGDGNTLFGAPHGNINTATGVAPNAASMAEGILAMKYQKDIAGLKRLNIKPAFLLAPAALEGTTEEFFQSKVYADAATDATRTNIYYNSIQRVYETRLDDADLAQWYLAAVRNTVKMYFLNGNKSPFMERQDEFSRDAVNWKIRMEASATAENWKGLYRNVGA